MKAYGFIHTHSEYSLKDAPLKLADIVKEAKKMGATAIALTDHGTAAGWIEFYDLCKNEGIKPILGVEAYIRSETNSRTHLILLAKNYTGYKEISQAISDSNENIERIADMDIPIMTKEILQKYLHKEYLIYFYPQYITNALQEAIRLKKATNIYVYKKEKNILFYKLAASKK